MDQDHPSTIRLAAHADRELSAPKSTQISEHLARCALCRGYVRELEEIRGELLSFALPPDLGNSIHESIMQALPVRQQRRRSNGLLPWLAPAALAAANIGLQAMLLVALVLTALSVFGVFDLEGILTARLATELSSDLASVDQVAGDVLGWLTYGSLGPAFRSLMDSAGVDAGLVLSWLVPIAVTLAISVALGIGFLSWLTVAWRTEARNGNHSLRTT